MTSANRAVAECERFRPGAPVPRDPRGRGESDDGRRARRASGLEARRPDHEAALAELGASLGVMPWVLRVCGHRVLSAVAASGASLALVRTRGALESALAGRLVLYLGGPLGRRAAVALAAAIDADPALATWLVTRGLAAEVHRTTDRGTGTWA